MVKDILLLLLGAAVGAVFGTLYPKLELYLRKRYWGSVSKHRSNLLASVDIRKWIEKYYTEKGKLNQLYCCRLGRFDQRIPVLTVKTWCQRRKLGKIPIIEIVNTPPQEFSTDMHLLKRRSSMGQRMFNDMALYPDRVDISATNIMIVTRRCKYFPIASNLIRLEEELFRAVDKSFVRRHRTPIRDRVLSSLEKASQYLLKPLSIGCATVLRLATNEGDKILIHRRSSQVITSSESIAVMPCFGLEPVDVVAVDQLEKDVLFLNFVKEFCEELFGIDDLISMSKHRQGLSSWILQFPEAKMMFSAFESGSALANLLGVGIDATNGTLILAIEVYIADKKITDKISELIVGNWEVAKPTPDIPVLELVPVTSNKFELWHQADAFSYPSAFALSLAFAK